MRYAEGRLYWLDRLTLEAGRLDQMTHKMSHSIKSIEDDKVQTR
jgi:hypothetical protein